MEKLVDFSIAKQKIIKTDELFKLYVKKNEDFEKTQKTCKTLKSKYEDIKNELKITKLKSENLLHRSQLAETKYLPLKDDYDKLKLKFDDLQKDTHLTINDLQVKYQTANQELVECQQELSQKKVTEEKMHKTENKGKQNKCLLKQQLINDELEMVSTANKELLNENSKLRDEIEKLKIQVINIRNYKSNDEVAQIKLELNKKDFELKQLKQNHDILKRDQLKEIYELQTKLSQFNYVKSNLETIQEKYNALKVEMSLLKSSQEESLQDLIKLKDSEQRLIEENLKLIKSNNQLVEINSEPTDPSIEDIYRELCVPRILSPLSSDDDNAGTIDNNYQPEMRQMIVEKTQNVENIVENNLISLRRNAKLERFKRKQKRNKSLKRRAPKIDLLATLIQLKNANINFTISNESILEPIPNNSNFILSTSSNKLSSFQAKNNIYKKKLKCGTSNCTNSYMLLSGKDRAEENANLLGFFEVKSEPFSISNNRIEDSYLKKQRTTTITNNKSNRVFSGRYLNNCTHNDGILETFDAVNKLQISDYEIEENQEDSVDINNSAFKQFTEIDKINEREQEDCDISKKNDYFKVGQKNNGMRKTKGKLSLKQRLLKRRKLLVRPKMSSLLEYSGEVSKVNNKNPVIFTETENINLAKKISLEAIGSNFNHNLNCNEALESKPLKKKHLPRSENMQNKTETEAKFTVDNNINNLLEVKCSQDSDEKVCDKKITKLIKPSTVKSPKSSYKRPICRTRQSLRLLAKSPQTKNCKNEKELESPASPLQSPEPEEMNDETPFIIPLEKIEGKEVEKMATTRMVMLISELLNFANSEEIVNNIVQEFVTQEPSYIAMAMLETVAQDFVDKPALNSTNFAVVTTTQSTLLGFMSKLEKRGVEVYKCFITIAEHRILTSKLLEEIDPISRLYLSICKIQNNINRIRRFCCDVFFHCGDLAVPFLFAILPSWTDIFPHATHAEEQPLVRVIVQIVHLKQCIKPGYNLMQLKNLLNKYYMYPTERWDSDELFQEMFCRYLKNPEKMTSLPLFLLCKNHPEKWLMEKIDQKFKPIIDQIPTENFKATVIILVGNLSCNFSSKSVPNYLPGIRTWFESLIGDTTPDLVKRSVEFALKKLSKK